MTNKKKKTKELPFRTTTCSVDKIETFSRKETEKVRELLDETP
jgi:hypothetical protein